MRLADIMSRPLETIAPDVPADEAWELMRRLGVRHLAVIGKDREVAGVLSDRDLGGKLSARARAGKKVADLMSAPAVTAPPDATVRRAANILRGRNLGCLPVVERGKPVGMVTVSDLLELVGRGAFRPAIAREPRPVLQTRGPRTVRTRKKV